MQHRIFSRYTQFVHRQYTFGIPTDTICIFRLKLPCILYERISPASSQGHITHQKYRATTASTISVYTKHSIWRVQIEIITMDICFTMANMPTIKCSTTNITNTLQPRCEQTLAAPVNKLAFRPALSKYLHNPLLAVSLCVNTVNLSLLSSSLGAKNL